MCVFLNEWAAEGPHRSVVAHFLYRLFSFLGVPDHKVHTHTHAHTHTHTHTQTNKHTHTTQGGIVLLLAGVCLTTVQRSIGRRLSVEVGGSKRLQALSSILTVAMLLPWAAIQVATQEIAVPSLHSVGVLVAMGMVQLADFYVTTIASGRVDSAQISRVGSLVAFSASLTMAALSWYSYPGNVEQEHALSVGVVLATVFFLLATATLTRPNPRSSSYSFVGYSSAGLPLYSAHRSAELSYSALLSLVRGGVRKIMSDRNSRRIFYFLLLNLVCVVYRSVGVFSCPCSIPLRCLRGLRCCMECGPTVWVSYLTGFICCLTVRLC